MDRPKWYTKHEAALKASGAHFMRRNSEIEHFSMQVTHAAYTHDLVVDGKLRDSLTWGQLRPFCNKATAIYMLPRGPVKGLSDIPYDQWIKDVCGPWHAMEGCHTLAYGSCFANFVRLPEEMSVAQLRVLHEQLCEQITAAIDQRTAESVEDHDTGTQELLGSCRAVFVVFKPYYTSSEKAQHTLQLVRTYFGSRIPLNVFRMHPQQSTEDPDVLRTTMTTAMDLISDLARPEEDKRRKLEDGHERLAERDVEEYLTRACTHGFDYKISVVRYWLEEAIVSSRASRGMSAPERECVLPKRLDYRKSMDIRKVPAFSNRKRARSCSAIDEESGSEDE
ncbi:hypothetical protein LTR85_007127 [Meristemomyces frigidus]|nr:hypothetical protein LTR85_007127 [Meristemomyces frigidus]